MEPASSTGKLSGALLGNGTSASFALAETSLGDGGVAFSSPSMIFSFSLPPSLGDAFGLAAPSDGKGVASLGEGVHSLVGEALAGLFLPDPLLGDGIVACFGRSSAPVALFVAADASAAASTAWPSAVAESWPLVF